MVPPLTPLYGATINTFIYGDIESALACINDDDHDESPSGDMCQTRDSGQSGDTTKFKLQPKPASSSALKPTTKATTTSSSSSSGRSKKPPRKLTGAAGAAAAATGAAGAAAVPAVPTAGAAATGTAAAAAAVPEPGPAATAAAGELRLRPARRGTAPAVTETARLPTRGAGFLFSLEEPCRDGTSPCRVRSISTTPHLDCRT